jgi:hypothetical protein
MRGLGVRINAFLRDAAATVRERFQGKLIYASIQFEQVNWTPFDMVTFELIRSAEVADRFRDAVRTLTKAPSRSPSPGSVPRPTAARETAVGGCWKWSSTTQ